MKKEFKDKVIAVFGASIDEHGYYMDNMRRFIALQDEKCYIVNRSIGGNYAELACNMVEDEIDTLNPDVVFVHFGTNDMGIYNYNANVPETEEILNARKERTERYFYNMRKLLALLKSRDLDVYVMTPVCTNENIFEKDDIETVQDNVDKAKNMKSDFYCKASFKKVNDHFATCVPELEKIALEMGAGIVNFFEETRKVMYVTDGMFNEDGIHYSRKGHDVLAKIFLKFLGYDNIPESFDIKNDTCSVINQLEQTERHIQFFRRWIFYPEAHKPFPEVYTEEQVKSKLKELMQDPKYPFIALAEAAEWCYDEQKQLRDRSFKLIKSL